MNPRSGFSLVEFLVVVGLLGLMVGLLMPAVQSVRATGQKLVCQNNLKQVGLASHHFADTTGAFPNHVRGVRIPGTTYRVRVNTWALVLTPYIEQESIWNTTDAAFKAAPAYLSPPHVGLGTVIKTYACPADGRQNSPLTDDRGFTVAYTSYVAILGDRPRVDPFDTRPVDPRLLGVMLPSRFDGSVRPAHVTDGLSNTIMYGESPPPGRYMAGSWYTTERPVELYDVRVPWRLGPFLWVREEPKMCRGPFVFSIGRIDNLCDTFHLWSPHPGGANSELADGSVRFLSYAAVDVIPALATRAGGEVVHIPD
jgi:type II secretory pathway pseudopilin PulG